MTPTDHPLTETAAHVTDEMVQAGHAAALGRSMGSPDTYRRIITAALAAAPAPTDPHHDTRPWQDCTRDDIGRGDLVETRIRDGLYVGVAHHQNTFGDWFTEANYLLTYDDEWPLRRIPAPTPPAEEIALPTEHPAHITDAETASGARCAHMALDRDGEWIGVDQDGGFRPCRPTALAAFTLPDGTRARRDGNHEDGTPRFVKEGEK